MISHDKKFIFIHIPKCADLSMEVFFKKEVKALGWQKEEGLEYSMRKQGLAQMINLYPHYFTFTFVRNPFDRFVSIWKHSERVRINADKKPNPENDYGYRPQKQLSLKEYAYLIKKGDLEQLSSFDKYHLKRQVDFILDFNKDHFFSIPRKTKNNCNFIGRFENFKNDFESLCQLLDIKHKTLPHANSSDDLQHYSEYYDEETVKIVQELYAKDIEHLGYRFNKDNFLPLDHVEIYDDRELDNILVKQELEVISPKETHQQRLTLEDHNTGVKPSIKIFKSDPMKSTPFDAEGPLMKQGILYTSHSDDCDICVARTIDPLKSLIQKHGSEKKYLLWTVEPRGDTHFTTMTSFEGVDIHIMNAYTGEIWLNNYFCLNRGFCDASHQANKSFILPTIDPDQSNFSRVKHKKVVALLGYRNNKKRWSLIRDGVELDLSYLRTQIALTGHQLGKVDIYGKNWPEGIALEDSRTANNWVAIKVEILKDYHFNLCFENTNINYYCTEKIWHSIQAGCLPIYYGKGNKIYEDFPKGSFLDYSEINDPDELFDYIDQMNFSEFRERMNLCIEVHNSFYQKINNYPRQERIDKIIEKLNLLLENT